MKMKHILCALDLEDETARTVAEQARSLAELSGARLTALFVVEHMDTLSEPQATAGIVDAAMRKVTAEAEKTMQDFISANFQGVVSGSRIAAGVPAPEILKAARDTDADIIMMGTRGKKGIERMLLGSAAASVVRDANRPVLTIPVGAAQTV